MCVCFVTVFGGGEVLPAPLPAALKPLSAKSGLLCLPSEHGENSSGPKVLTAESCGSTWRLIGLAAQPGIMQSGVSGGASSERAVFNGAWRREKEKKDLCVSSAVQQQTFFPGIDPPAI